MRIWAIVLAAGEGSRLGGGKLTLPYGSGTIVRSVAESVLRARPAGLIVVLGNYRTQVRAALQGIPAHYAENPDPGRGMLSSVKCGLRAVPDDADGFLVALGDQPEIQLSTIQALVMAAESGDGWMYIPDFAGKRGHPVLFRREARESTLALPDESSLNSWRIQHWERVRIVPVDAPEVLRDIDTPEDYREAIRRAEG